MLNIIHHLLHDFRPSLEIALLHLLSNFPTFIQTLASLIWLMQQWLKWRAKGRQSGNTLPSRRRRSTISTNIT